MTVDDTFAKLVGRPASEAERIRLYRLRDASGFADLSAKGPTSPVEGHAMEAARRRSGLVGRTS
jgi:hypothetical protein